MIDEGRELGRGRPAVGTDYHRAVLVVAHVQVGEVFEMHLDGALLSQRTHLPAARASLAEVSVQRRAVRHRFVRQLSLQPQDVQQRRGPALGLLLA